MMRKTGIVVALSLVVSSQALGAEPPAKGAPAPKKEEPKKEEVMMKKAPEAEPAPPKMDGMPGKPAAELDALKFYTANWKCDSKGIDPASGAEMTAKSTIKVKWDLGKHWAAYEYKMAKTKAMPAMTGKGYIGWDAGQKKYIFGGVDDWGGIMMLTAAAAGDTVTWEGSATMMGQQMKTRFTWKKVSEKEMTTTFEAQMGKEWKAMGTDTCKK